METLRTRCQILTGIFVGIVAASFIAALSTLVLLNYLGGIASGEPVDEAWAERIDNYQALTGIIQFGLIIACTIVFLMWFHRAHKNLKAAGLRHLKYTPGWAVGGFFVPFLNLVRPFQVMKETWLGSVHLSSGDEEASWAAALPPARLGWWWALFLISSALGNAAGRLMLFADELDELITAAWVMLASDLMDIPTALLALYLVRRITQFQEQARTRSQATEFPLGE